MAKARHFFEKLQKLVNGITGLMLIAIMVIIFVQTFTRYVIFYSIPWSEEASMLAGKTKACPNILLADFCTDSYFSCIFSMA